jgi:hypothetical protein
MYLFQKCEMLHWFAKMGRAFYSDREGISMAGLFFSKSLRVCFGVD